MNCSCCGRELPPEIFVNGKKRQRLLECLQRYPNGRTVWDLLEYVYRDDPGGGPEHQNVISVMVMKINSLIRDQGWKITATGGPGSTYHLVRI